MNIRIESDFIYEATLEGFAVGRKDCPKLYFFREIGAMKERLERQWGVSQNVERPLEERKEKMELFELNCARLLEVADSLIVVTSRAGFDAISGGGRRRPLPVVEGKRELFDPNLIAMIFIERRSMGMSNGEITRYLNSEEDEQWGGPLYTAAGRPWTKDALESFISRMRKEGKYGL